MKKSFKKISRIFKTDTDVFIEELNDTRQSFDKAIQQSAQNIRILESALKEHIALRQHLNEKKRAKQMRIESLHTIITQYLLNGKEAAAKELIRDKVKEQHILLGLMEILDLQNIRISEYQQRIKKATDVLDDQKSQREAFIIKQRIALQELLILKKLDKHNGKKHIERIKTDIMDEAGYKAMDPKEDVPIASVIDREIERELAVFKVNYPSSGLQDY